MSIILIGVGYFLLFMLVLALTIAIALHILTWALDDKDI